MLPSIWLLPPVDRHQDTDNVHDTEHTARKQHKIVEIVLILIRCKYITNDKKVKVFQSILVCCVLFCDTCGDVTAERNAGGSNKMEGNTEHLLKMASC